ncbi:MAG: hypothetical protein F6J93_37645 [Oscillatoria sp. SIO1A7]|nr:hypothetical protein [Oscillatoria sp. SIO1A7]
MRYPSFPSEALAADLAEEAVTLAMKFELGATQRGWSWYEEVLTEKVGKQLFDYIEKHLADSPNKLQAADASIDKSREMKQAIAWAASLNTSSPLDKEFQKKTY